VDNVVIDVPCLPTPVTHHVIWDSAADIGFTAEYAVRLRAKTDSGVQGTWVETGDFAVDNTSPAGGPTAVITADKLCAQTGEDIQFSAMSSLGSPTTFHWSFGDGSYSSATEPVHAFQTGDGVFNVMLTVTDGAGLSDTAMQPIKVTELITDYRTELEPYRNYAEQRALFEALADAYPDIMMVYTIGYSVMGREIFAVKISDNVTVDEDEPVIHFDGEHHAREVMTPEVMIDIAEQLVTNYGPATPEVEGWIDSYEIYIVPCVNPDATTPPTGAIPTAPAAILTPQHTAARFPHPSRKSRPSWLRR
jgi:PKD repeat protein